MRTEKRQKSPTTKKTNNSQQIEQKSVSPTKEANAQLKIDVDLVVLGRRCHQQPDSNNNQPSIRSEKLRIKLTNFSQLYHYIFSTLLSLMPLI